MRTCGLGSATKSSRAAGRGIPNMKSKVIKEFYGVIDGQIYPRMVLVGEIIHGDLAETALREKWATVHFEEGAKPEVVFVEKLHELSEKAKAMAGGAAAVEAEAARAVADAKLAPADEQQARILDNMAAAGIGGVSSKLAAMKVRDAAAPVPIDIPEGWQALKWPALKSLAESLKRGAISNKDDARIAIEAELGARAAK